MIVYDMSYYVKLIVLSIKTIPRSLTLFVLLISAFYQHDMSHNSVGRGDSSHFPHIYDYAKTRGAGIVCSSVMVVPHMTFMHSEYP